ncbi:zinc finger protein 14 homolog isoform X5 [Aricia agestis]|uniref:zinc finger protein 14 homolog isoform X5 n=1 Tax=Aricia agestis TaxID=91739 RepID=UPI001C20B3D5|nr:zinc finger protein 14 homolog isoform X5 [Aricia agestis]
MEFQETVVKDSPGLCRCCLSEGCYKELGAEYTWFNETEIYADMLLDCFDISISQHVDGPNGPNRLICEVCITRLRDACEFKKQVLESEKKFINMVCKGEFSKTVLVYKDPVKVELKDNLDTEYLDEDLDLDNDDLPEKIEIETPLDNADLTASVSAVKKKRGRPKKTLTEEEKPTPKKAKLEDKPRTSKGVKTRDIHKVTKCFMTTTHRNRLMKRNAVTIIESSTVFPFKWHRHDYLCFYCHKPFKELEVLREHSGKEHKKANVESAVSYLKRDEKVKIDISECVCKLCDKAADDLDSLVDHLRNTHNKNFEEACGYGVVPYKLSRNRYQCAVCSKTFQYFIKLNQHMNEHFGLYVCEHCGKSFLTQDRLRFHALSHGSNFKCASCSETFESLAQRTSHEMQQHNRRKLIKCLHCSETFKNYLLRKLHHNSVHNVKLTVISCPVCSKPFHVASKMWAHCKEVHVRERNFSCTMCEKKFFTRTHVQKHMVKHLGERTHHCEICKKSYARKQTLRDHMRIHNGDRRYACTQCSQAFVQNTSLKLHMKVHHPQN